jgi:hypothetical protein
MVSPTGSREREVTSEALLTLRYLRNHDFRHSTEFKPHKSDGNERDRPASMIGFFAPAAKAGSLNCCYLFESSLLKWPSTCSRLSGFFALVKTIE